MKMKLLLTLAFLLLAAPGAFAQTAGDGATKMKVAIIDSMVFRDEVLELKAKYEKLQTEFASKARDLESMANSIANKQKVAQENKTLTPQQAQKLNDEIEQLKKEYNRSLQDSQDLAGKREKAETEDVYDKLIKFLEQYCAKKGITTVFDARRLQDTGVVVYAAQASNITKDFISEYNKVNPVQTAANPAK
ncbi:MAG TPA: OmpH family outer membrane protein [Blastocatellia bacterium]|nr:OmpH family outer membrane protein [Blastocatellia bacterium]